MSQAEALDELLETEDMGLDAVLDLEAPEEEVVKRIAGRRVCRNDSAHVFHVTYTPPKQEGVCDVCGGELYQRDDDSEETVRKRLEVPHADRADYRLLQGAGPGGDHLGHGAGGRGHGPRAGGAQAREVGPARGAQPRSASGRAAAVVWGAPYRCRCPSLFVVFLVQRRAAAHLVQIKSPEQIAKMREAGLVVAAIHAATREAAVPGATTRDLDQVARKVLADHGAKPNFLGSAASPRPSAPP
ncbi:Adenylate kinase [Streptomyces fumanus]